MSEDEDFDDQSAWLISELVDRTKNGVPDIDTGQTDTPATLRSGIVDSSFAAEGMLQQAPLSQQSVCEEELAEHILEEYKQANVRRHVDAGTPNRTTSMTNEKKDPKVLWTKALWWATQEVRRRKLTELHLAPVSSPGSNNSKGKGFLHTVKSLRRGLSSFSAVKVRSLPHNSVAPSGHPSGHSEESPSEREWKKSTTFISAARLWRTSTDRNKQPDSPARDLEQGFVSPVPILSARPMQCSTRSRDGPRSNRRGSVGSLQPGDSIQSSVESRCDTEESPKESARKRDSLGASSESLHVFHSEHKNTQKTSPTEPQTFHERLIRILNGKNYMIFSISCLLWVLGGREIYILGDPPLSSDRPVYCLYLVCLLQLLLDLMLRSPFERHYFLSFYFWLDVSVFSVKWKYCQIQDRK